MRHLQFTIKIPKTENVSILKDLIKEKKAHDLNHVNALKLILSQVSLPVDDGLGKNLKNVAPMPLNPIIPLSQVFPCVKENCLHIIIQAPSKGDPISAVLHIADGLIGVFRGFDFQ